MITVTVTLNITVFAKMVKYINTRLLEFSTHHKTAAVGIICHARLSFVLENEGLASLMRDGPSTCR